MRGIESLSVFSYYLIAVSNGSLNKTYLISKTCSFLIYSFSVNIWLWQRQSILCKSMHETCGIEGVIKMDNLYLSARDLTAW